MKNTMSEKQIERKCCKIAESQGWMVFKLVCPNMIGVPDRMFVGKRERVFWVEFKKPGGRISPPQQRVIDKFHKMGHTVFVVDSVWRFELLLEEL